MILVIGFWAIFFLLIVTLIYFAWGGFSAAPWVPARSKDVVRALELVKPQPHETFLDLGSGDGRTLITAAQAGVQTVVGVEIVPLLVWWSRFRAWQKGFRKQIAVHHQSLWKADLSQADIIFCFLMPKAIGRLEEKIQKEAKPGARVISYVFEFPNLKVLKKSQPTPKVLPIFLYQV